MKLTLRHIGVISIGRILAIVSFIIYEIMVMLATLGLLVMVLLGGAVASQSNQLVGVLGGGIVGVVFFFIVGSVGSVVAAIVYFLFGALVAILCNVMFGVAGGIDFDFNERGGRYAKFENVEV